MSIVLHDLTDSRILDREARQEVCGGGSPEHTFRLPGYEPVWSETPEHAVETDGEPPQHDFQLGW